MSLFSRSLIQRWIVSVLLVVGYVASTTVPGAAQPNKSGGSLQNGSSTPGDSRLLSHWPMAAPAYADERIIQYTAVETSFGASQPIVLEPVLTSMPSVTSPLRQRQKLVVIIDDPSDLFEKYCVNVLNLNVSSQSGTAESPASLRPSQSTGGGGAGGGAAAASIGVGGTNPSLAIILSAQCVPVGSAITATVYGAGGNLLSAQPVTFNPGGYQNNTDGNGVVPFVAAAPGQFNASASIPIRAPVAPATVPPPGTPNLTVTANFHVYTPSAHTYFLPWVERLSPDTAITVSVTALTPALSQDPTGSTAQPVTVLNQTFNHVHALNTYNISTGIIYSGLRNPSFSRQESSAPVTCPTGTTGCTAEPEMYQTVTTPGARTVDPALFFTIYAFGKFDAERPWHPWDLKPEPTVGLSLSSPGSDYFFGAMSEVWRGVQVVGGLHEGKINQLVPPLVNDPTSSAAPVTKQVFNHSGFIGVTFNISFIQTLFGGKGGG
jgi:hypothetical protein